MHSAAKRNPSSRDNSGRRWPLSTRQYWPPSSAHRSIAFFCWSICSLSKCGIGMREVGRRSRASGFPVRDRLRSAETLRLRLVSAARESGCKTRGHRLEVRADFDPFAQRHRAVDAQGIHVCLGKRSQSRHQSPFFTGLRPIIGNCSSSTTLPLIGRLSSDSQ